MAWYPIECEHGYDHCPKCDAPKIIGVDLASGPDITALWCSTCGVSTSGPGECDACRKWWKENQPGPDYSAVTREIVGR